MARTVTLSPEKEKVENHEKGHVNGMVPLAERIERHHTQPAPDAHAPLPDPFPMLLWHGLGWGTLAGMILGAFFAWLLRSGALVVPGWEGLFSMVPITFYTFWIMLGAALGLVIGGISTILAADSARAVESS